MFEKLGLSLAAAVAALLFAEVLVRLLGVAPQAYAIRKGRFQLSHNPLIGYEPVPMVYNGKEQSFYDYTGASNSLGYRDVEHPVAKPHGIYRIVVLGDSIAAGLHIESYEETFPAVLEAVLRRRGLRAEVINFGVSGYNTQQEVETFIEKGLRYQPDLVLLAYTLSSRGHLDGDILATLLEAERAKRSGGGVSDARVNALLVHSALYRFLRFRVLARHGRAEPPALPPPPFASPPSAEPPPSEPDTPAPPPATAGAQAALPPPAVVPPLPQDPSRVPLRTEEERRYLALVSGDTVAQYFERLAELARERRFQVLVAVFPRFTRSFAAYRFAGQHAYARELARRNGFGLLDLIGPLSQCRAASPEPIELDSFHPSPAGHRCAGRAIALAILGGLPASPAGAGSGSEPQLRGTVENRAEGPRAVPPT